MTKYKSTIKLGEKYRDERSGIEGHATSLVVHSTGCKEVKIEYGNDKIDLLTGSEIREKYFPEARLTPTADNPDFGETDVEETVYKSDIKLDEYYTSGKEKIEGRAAYIEFHEHMANRVAVQTIQNKNGNKQPKTWMIDEYRLKNLETDKPVSRQPGSAGRGPAIARVPETPVTR